MPADIIVYAVIAAGLVFWLRSVLGTRHGDERSRHSPYLSPAESKPEPATDYPAETRDRVPGNEDMIAELAENPLSGMSIKGADAESGLLKIAKADREFDVKAFLTGAQDAFAIIVEAFAGGDRETLKNLLAPVVYDSFDAAITAREKEETVQETEIRAIREAEITEARLEGKTAFITVRFTADETSVTKDKDGKIVGGDPDKTAEMHDVWVFSRNLKSRDPRWPVVETRGGHEGDSETVPNSD